ncbi:hypothetical protein [Luteibacter sp. dw_328]|uniref:hypothetical protein n=1 Tax=Luteibacter sp. dw_328 TaxID=2719796 RepID=UPI001BD68B8B|nr:hypothetical protein [Luteibacter sp. dw_328]
MLEKDEVGPLIAVVDDATVHAGKQPTAPPSVTDDWAKVAQVVMLASTRMNFVYLGAGLAYGVYKHLTKDKELGSGLVPVGLSSAKKLLRFPPGHPLVRGVYARHPTEDALYYPAAIFHRKVFEHKLAEVCLLLASLGAREIRAEHTRGWGKDFAANLSVPLEAPGANAGASFSSKDSKTDRIVLHVRLKGHDTPTLPEDMVWYEHEFTWKAVAKMRLNSEAVDFALSLSYEDDFQVNTSLKASAKDAGLDIGGTFVDHVSTVWNITGTFGPV